ncbi:MAG: hypothetical protein RLZZ546_2872 [Bacteroidota bacterium]|jgi:hypothetical protein
MNKKVLTILFLALVGIASMVYYKKGKTDDLGLDLSDREFKIEKPEKLNKIIIERAKYPAIVFVKKGNDWILNNGKKASDEIIPNIISLINKMKIQYIPNPAHTKNIHNFIKEEGIHFKAYVGEEVVKSFFVGADVAENKGTSFLIEGAKQPYVMHLPFFDGSLRSRFSFEMSQFETKMVFEENPENITEVTVNYPGDKASSFKILNAQSTPEVSNLYDGIILKNANQKKIKTYLDGFTKIGAEYNDADNALRYEIIKKPIFAEITVKRKDGSMKKVDLYSLSNIEFKTNYSSPKEMEPSMRLHANTNTNEFFLTQHRVIGKLLVAYDNFGDKN